MNNYKQYEMIQKYFESYNDVVVLDILIADIAKTLSFKHADVKLVLDTMINDQEAIVVEDQFYLLNGKPYIVGQFKAVRENFGFVENLDNSIYVGKDDFNGVMDLDDCLVRIESSEKQFGVVVAIIKHHKEFVLGTIVDNKGQIEFKTYDKKIFKPIEFAQTPKGVKDNDRIIVRIQEYGETLKVVLESVLGQADEPGMDVLSVLVEHELPTEFPQEVLDSATQVPSEVIAADIKGRMDHRDQYVITIDGEDAKDLDDAIYMERRNNGYRLYVHIADVSHYVTQGSVIDEEAYNRSSSIYMVDRVVPMLPQVLSNGICSLHPNVDRLTMTVQIDFDMNGNVDDYNIYDSVIQSKQRLSYNQVNANKDLGLAQDQVDMMLECAARLQYKREQAGSIGFDSDESQFVIDAQGKVLDVFKRTSGVGEAMIESFMVSANEVVAQYAKYQFLPIVYRVHEHPSKEKMQDLSHTLRILGYRMKGQLDEVKPKTLQKALEYFENKPEYHVVSRLMLRSMSKARYAPEPIGHFGLALEDYTHFTSPIRRYADLMLHQRIKKYRNAVSDKNKGLDDEFASEAGLHISERERTILEAERTVEKIKKCQFMEDKVGERYTAYVSGVSGFGMFVELDNTIEGLVHVRTMRDDYYIYDQKAQKLIGESGNNEYSIGQKVRVKLVSVDLEENVIMFELLRERKPRRPQNNRPDRGRSDRNRSDRNRSERSRSGRNRKDHKSGRPARRGAKNDRNRKKS